LLRAPGFAFFRGFFRTVRSNPNPVVLLPAKVETVVFPPQDENDNVCFCPDGSNKH